MPPPHALMALFLAGLLWSPAVVEGLSFEEIGPALTAASKHQILTAPSVTIGDTTSATPYVPLYRTGDEVGTLSIGEILDKDGFPVRMLDWTTGEPQDEVLLQMPFRSMPPELPCLVLQATGACCQLCASACQLSAKSG